MKTKTTREQALEWYNNLVSFEKEMIEKKYSTILITDSNIERVWKLEQENIQSNVKTINGQRYSTKDFGDYKLRVMIDVETHRPNNVGAHPYETNITLYTTETDIDEIKCILEERFVKNVKKYKIIHTATKEQDDVASEFLKEHLKNDW